MAIDHLQKSLPVPRCRSHMHAWQVECTDIDRGFTHVKVSGVCIVNGMLGILYFYSVY